MKIQYWSCPSYSNHATSIEHCCQCKCLEAFWSFIKIQKGTSTTLRLTRRIPELQVGCPKRAHTSPTSTSDNPTMSNQYLVDLGLDLLSIMGHGMGHGMGNVGRLRFGKPHQPGFSTGRASHWDPTTSSVTILHATAATTSFVWTCFPICKWCPICSIITVVKGGKPRTPNDVYSFFLI